MAANAKPLNPGQVSTVTLEDVIAATEARSVEFQAFGSHEKIKLTVPIVLKYLCTPTRKGFVCDEKQAVKFIMLCKARQLNPFEGDAFLVGYDDNNLGPVFSLITAHQAFLKRAEVNPRFDGMESGVVVLRNVDVVDDTGKVTKTRQVFQEEGDMILPGDTLIGGWATVHLKDRQIPVRKRVNLSTFDTGYSRWKKDPGGMIVKCAEADALRSAFPTVLGGMFLDEELTVPPEDKNVPVPTPTRTIPTGRTTVKPPAEAAPAAPVTVPAESVPEEAAAPEPPAPEQPDAGAFSEPSSVTQAEPDAPPPADEAPPAENEEQKMLGIIAKIEGDIAAAQVPKGVAEAAALMTIHKDALGAEEYKRLHGLYSAKMKELSAKPKGGGK